MNLGSMRGVVRRRIGNPSTTDVTDAVINEHLNDALEEIRDKYAFLRARGRARFTTTVGVDKYDISAITDALLEVWDRTNDKRLTKVGPRFVAEHEFDDAEDEKPTLYARFEDYIQLLGDGGGPPDGTYVIEVFYRSKASIMGVDADEPDIPRAWHKGICILAAFNYYDVDGKDAAKAQYQMAAFQRWVADKPVEAHEEGAVIDSGVVLPTIDRGHDKRLDFERGP